MGFSTEWRLWTFLDPQSGAFLFVVIDHVFTRANVQFRVEALEVVEPPVRTGILQNTMVHPLASSFFLFFCLLKNVYYPFGWDLPGETIKNR